MIGKLLFPYIPDFKLEDLKEYPFSVKDLILKEKEKLVQKVKQKANWQVIKHIVIKD